MKPDELTSHERIQHILNAIQDIQSFTEGFSLDGFKRDTKTYYACLYQFAVIGEAVVNSGNKILEKYDYPWYKVRSFRNFIMHEYHAIDVQVVWDTIRLILPGFKKMMEYITEKEFDAQ